MRSRGSGSGRRGRVKGGRLATRGVGVVVGTVGLVVKEVEATAKAKWVVFRFVKSVPLGLVPEGLGVLWHFHVWSRWRWVADEGVGFHFAELRVGKPRSPPRQREGPMPSLVDGNRHTVENHGLSVPGLGGRNHRSGQIVETGGSRGEGVCLAIEFFSDRRDEAQVYAQFAQVTGNFLHAKHARFGLYAPVNLSPKVGVGALGRGVSVDDVLKPRNHRVVVDEDVDRSFSTGSKVNDGQSLRDLGILSKAMDTGAVVHAVVYAVIDTEASPSKERNGLIGAGTVCGRVGPGPPSDGVSVSGVSVGAVPKWGRARYGLGKWIPGEFSLKVEKPRVFVKEPTVSSVRGEPGPLLIADEIGERGTLAFPALTVADCVLLGFLLFITVAAYRAWVSRSI